MSEKKHSPEPWKFTSNDPDPVDSRVYGVIETWYPNCVGVAALYTSLSDFPNSEANGQRIVACVNPLAGIPSPAEFVEAARLLANETRFMLQKSKNIESVAWEVKVQNAVAIVLNEPRKDA